MRAIRKTLLACAFLAGGAGLAQAASMSSGWENISMTQDQCLSTGVSAIQALGFQPDRQQFFVGGWRGNDGIVVRCASDRNMVIIFVYLADGGVQQSSQAVDQIRAVFQGGGARPGGK